MKPNLEQNMSLPEDLKNCVEFHGHLCPGLVYGYIVAKEAVRALDIKRSEDEEVVAVSENDSCAVDSIQVILGTTAGKGNLILKDFGKNAYTVMNRSTGKAVRFSRKDFYRFEGEEKAEFDQLEAAISSGTATDHQNWRHKTLKAKDLLAKPFSEVFETQYVSCELPPYAPLAPSKACAICGEMTMSTKMVTNSEGELVCLPCSKR